MRRRPYWLGRDSEAKILKAKKRVESEGENSGVVLWEPRMSLTSIKTLLDFRENNLFYDAVLVLDDGTNVRVHKAILSASSPFFLTMFTTSLNPPEKREFRLASVPSEVLNQILNYAYCGDLTVQQDNVFGMFNAADYLGITPILRLCCEFLQSVLDSSNCLGILLFARQYKDELCRSLALHAYRYVMENFSYVAIESEEILSLPLEDFSLVISADDLNIRNEQIVWECVLRWMRHDQVNRRGFLLDLLQDIRFGMMNTDFFVEIVKTHPYVEEEGRHKGYVVEVMKKLYEIDHTKLPRKFGDMEDCAMCKPRIPNEIILAIGGWSGGSATNCVEAYDTKADMWVVVPYEDAGGPRAYHGTVVLGWNVYVIGGFDGNDQYYNSCRRFDAVKKVWYEIAPMNCKRCYAIGDVIYAMGGYDGLFRRNTAERYNIHTNQWTLVAPMNVQRSDAGAATLNGCIFIAGGFDGAFCLKSAEMYDPAINQWTLIAPMLSKRSGVSCVAHHGHLYVLGGFNGTARMYSCEKYIPESNTWTKLTSMYTPRSNFGVAVLDDMIYAIGGFNGVTTVFRVECFDDHSNRWFEVADMQMYRSALSACVVRGLPNMIDYIYLPNRRLDLSRKHKLLGLINDDQAKNTNPSPES